MGDSGSQALGFALAACGIAATFKVAQTTVATLLLPLLILAVPILDTTLVTILRLFEGSPGLPRRTRPHVTPARLPRALGPPGGVPARDDLRRARRDEPDVHRRRRREDHRDRRPPDLRVVRPVRELPGRRRAQPDTARRTSRERSSRGLGLVIHRRRVVEVVVDAILITVSLYAAYVLRLGSNGTPTQRSFLFATASDPAVLALPRLHSDGALPRRLALRRRARRGTDRGGGAGLGVHRLRRHVGPACAQRLPARQSSSSTPCSARC